MSCLSSGDSVLGWVTAILSALAQHFLTHSTWMHVTDCPILPQSFDSASFPKREQRGHITAVTTTSDKAQ